MDFLNNYPPTTIIGVLFGVAGGVVAAWKLIDYLWDKVRGHFDKHYHSKAEQNEILDRIAQQEMNHAENDASIKALADNIMSWQKTIEGQIEDHGEKIDLLIRSDRNSAKAWIVQQYHYYTEQKGYIDDFSLDSIEKRYESYVEEEGNSYVSLLMDEIRKLPKHPPKEGGI